MPRKKGIMILGIGGAGCNFLRSLEGFQYPNVELWALDSNLPSLKRSNAPYKLILPSNPSDQASLKPMRPAFDAAKLVFLIAGLGGKTGTTVAPILAQWAKTAGAKTVALLFFPFQHEGSNRKALAQTTISKIKDSVDTLKIIQNEKINGKEFSNLDLSSSFNFLDHRAMEEIRSRI